MLTPDDALDRLGSIRLTDHSMRSLLEEIARLAQQSLPGRLETSVTLLTGDDATTAVSTGQLARDLDETQYALGHGPCMHAAAEGEPVEIPDARTEARWPDYAGVAAEHGCLSSLSLPLPLHERVSGALNIYARQAAAFDDRSRGFARRFATYGAVVAGNMLVFESALDRARNLEAALASRAVIDQAKGVLMERFKMTADEAFQALVGVSMKSNTKVRDIAERFVLTGELGGGRADDGRGFRTRS
jgi:transcriptional regulator with GAF, ATPase, and Fis domain